MIRSKRKHLIQTFIVYANKLNVCCVILKFFFLPILTFFLFNIIICTGNSMIGIYVTLLSTYFIVWATHVQAAVTHKHSLYCKKFSHFLHKQLTWTAPATAPNYHQLPAAHWMHARHICILTWEFGHQRDYISFLLNIRVNDVGGHSEVRNVLFYFLRSLVLLRL